MRLDWQRQTYTLSWLRDRALVFIHLDSAANFLYVIGIAPMGMRLNPCDPRTELDPERIPANYLLSVACEWDTWGPSSPVEFINALSCEVRGAKRDIIIEALNAARGVPLAGPTQAPAH